MTTIFSSLSKKLYLRKSNALEKLKVKLRVLKRKQRTYGGLVDHKLVKAPSNLIASRPKATLLFLALK